MNSQEKWGEGEHMCDGEIHYALDELWVLFGWGCIAVPLLIRALSIPPRKVGEFTLNSCSFLIVDETLKGQVIAPHHIRGRYIIVIHPSANANFNASVHTVLHEIAHAALAHCDGALCPRSPLVIEREEREANRLVAEWMRAARYRAQGEAKHK